MIYELKSMEFKNIRHLITPLTYHLAIESIIHGFTEAKIIVDDMESPTTAFTWYKNRAWLIGNPDNSMFNEILHCFLNQSLFKSIKQKNTRLVLNYYPTEWVDYFDILFSNVNQTKGIRHYYQIDPSSKSWEIPIFNEFVLHFIDRSLLSNNVLKNLCYVLEEMQSEQSSLQDFLNNSYGFCAIINKEIVSWCMTEYNLKNRCELGIATIYKYRRRGIAFITASTIINHAFNQGIRQIGWHCWADNTPSNALAQKLGFTKQTEYPVLILSNSH